MLISITRKFNGYIFLLDETKCCHDNSTHSESLINLGSFFPPSSCLPSSNHFFCYVPFSPPLSSYAHFFFYFFSLSFFLHPLFFHVLSFLPPFSPFMVSLLRRCCSLVALFCVFFPCLLQHYMQCCKRCSFLCSSFPCVLQIAMFFFNAISSCNVLYDYMMMLHSSFLQLLQIKVLLFNATSSCNVFYDVIMFFFSAATTNYNVFFLWNIK